jgi:CheY-like chemotaxis protein
VEQAQPLMEARQHHFDVALPPFPLMVTGDHKRLVQVLVNVLNNAAKYTPTGGIIKLSAHADADQVLLVVSDNGIGMSAELRNHVFDLFAQAQRNADRSQGGLGLGLALVKSLVELHGGSVAVDSPGEQQGSTFTITLPGTRQPAPPVHAGQPALPSQQLRVLVVDDNVDAAQTLQLLLEAAGHRVIVAHSAVDALEAAQKTAPQLCLLDIGLPGISGYELARGLRALPATASAALVAITGYGRREDRELAQAAGFDHYFVKPVEMEALQALIAGLPSTSGAP